MRKGMISLLSVLALAFIFAGCGGSDGSSTSSSSQDSTTVVDDTNSNIGTDDTIDAYDKYGISSDLGTPPEIPGQ